jgi:hypothetical protein
VKPEPEPGRVVLIALKRNKLRRNENKSPLRLNNSSKRVFRKAARLFGPPEINPEMPKEGLLYRRVVAQPQEAACGFNIFNHAAKSGVAAPSRFSVSIQYTPGADRAAARALQIGIKID